MARLMRGVGPRRIRTVVTPSPRPAVSTVSLRPVYLEQVFMYGEIVHKGQWEAAKAFGILPVAP
jgi:hypothetical protein